MMVSNGNYQAWLDCWSSFRRRTHWSRNHRLRNGFWMSLLNIAASLCSNCPGTDWLPRRLLPLLCRRLTTFLGSLNPDRRRTNPRHLDTLQLSSSSDRSGNVPVCAFAACIMPTHLRFRRRSFLGLLFLFSLSTSVLYFIYSAPGIGKSSEAIIGNIPTVWGCLCGLWVMCDSSACCHWEWRRAKEPCVSAELRAPFPVISTYLTTVITVRLISIMATTMLMFVGLTAMIVTLVRRATTGSTGGMLVFFLCCSLFASSWCLCMSHPARLFFLGGPSEGHVISQGFEGPKWFVIPELRSQKPKSHMTSFEVTCTCPRTH